MVNGSSELLDGSKTLKNGTSELYSKTGELTDGIDVTISEKIDEMLDGITGGNTEVVSFVSAKNTNVTSVQFVIQTEAVEIEEVEEDAPVVEEKLSFWEKLLRLFGIDNRQK